MSGHELLEFLDRQSHPWDTTFDGKDISQIMKVVYRCYQPRRYGFGRGRNNLLSHPLEPITEESVTDTQENDCVLAATILPDPGLPNPVQISLLSNLGISESGVFLMHSLNWSNESMVTLIEDLGDVKQIVICDLEKKKKVTIRIDADHAVVNSTYTFTAFNKQTDFAILQLSNSLITFELSDVKFWRWISAEKIGLVSGKNVLVWDHHSQVEKVFELPSRMINFEITNLEIDKTNSWIIICGSQKIEREMKGLICLFSIKRDICEFHLGHCATFLEFKLLGNQHFSNLLCLVLNENNGKKILIKELEAPRNGDEYGFPTRMTPFQMSSCDYTVSIKMSHLLQFIYVITRYGHLSIFDVQTGFLITSLHFSHEEILSTISRKEFEGVNVLTLNGKVLTVLIVNSRLLEYLKMINPTLAEQILKRLQK